MGDAKRIREMEFRNACLHEAAHSVVRQLVLGNLGVTGVEERGSSYSYPVECKPLVELERSELSKVAMVVAAGIFAEDELCKKIGNQNEAVSDDIRQWEGIRRIGDFSKEEMKTLGQEASRLVREHEKAVRKVALELDRKRKLTGEQVSWIIKASGTASCR